MRKLRSSVFLKNFGLGLTKTPTIYKANILTSKVLKLNAHKSAKIFEIRTRESGLEITAQKNLARLQKFPRRYKNYYRTQKNVVSGGS